MNKMKKLLSVVLAVVLAFSGLSILGSAAITEYKTVANLNNLDAYSDYGQVTRLSTLERASMVQDFLDTILKKANIDMGTLIDVAGITVTINLTSVDKLCETVDGLQDALGSGLVGLAAGIVNLGVLEKINLDTWQTGITRAGSASTLVFYELFELLGANKTVIADILRTGTIDLGIISLGDMSAVTDIIGDLPGMVKGLVWGLLERWDDTLEEINALETSKKGNGQIEATLAKFVKDLFTNDMSISTVKLNASGAITSKHSLPTSGTRVIYNQETTGTNLVLVAKSYATEEFEDAAGKTVAAGSYYVTAKYVLEPEVGTSDYVWHQVNLDKNGDMKVLEDGSYDYVGGDTPNLKYYEQGTPLLPGLDFEVDIVNMSAGELLYKFFPIVFENMAPVVLNGSVKKLLAEFVGVKFNYVGKAMSDEVLALGNDAIFAGEQGEYLWEWSDYAVIDGAHYYRYLDDVYAGDISHVNNYFDIINWEFEVTGDFMDEFIPANDDNASDRILLNLSDFLAKVGNLVLLPTAETDDTASDYTATWTRPTFAAGNANFVSNVKALAQAVVGLAPQHIFGDDYATNDRCYVDLMLSEDNDTVLVGIAATIVDLVMPSMTLPSKDEILGSGAKVGAILAAAIREFAAYLTPEYNYDDLIYTDFGTTEGDPVKSFVQGKDSNYWLDVCLTMGINVGFEYLRAFADMGEGTAEWNAFVAASGYAVDGKTYTEADLKLNEDVNHWESMLDYIIDWALDKDYEWTWKMENFVDVSTFTIDLATAQDPWVKLQAVLGSILPVDEILTVEPAEGQTKIEHFLREDLILGIVDLKWDHLINTIQFNGPNNYFRKANILDQVAPLVKGIVNSLLKKIGGGSYQLLPAAMTDLDSLANQSNIATLVENLLGALTTAYNNGILDTVLPILNMFIGWHTDPQKLAEPEIWVTNNEGKDFAYQTSTTIGGTAIHFLNNSAGMLEIHRNSDVTDHEYAIQIKSVTSDATVNTLSFNYGDGHASPYETIDIAVSGSYKGEEAVTVTIAYEYIGKDGNAIGGMQYTSRTIFFSNQKEDADVTEAQAQMKSGLTWETRRNEYNKFIFAEDIYTAINEAQVSVNYKNSVSGSTPFSTIEAPNLSIEVDPTPDNTCNDDSYWEAEPWPTYDQYAQTYFTYRTTQSETGWPSKIESNMISGWGTGAGKFYKAKAEYGPDYEFPYGIYAFQDVAVQYDGEAVYKQVFIHYDDYDIDVLYAENMNNGYNANQGVDAATYNEYNAAWKDVVKLATYPMMTSTNGHSSTDYVTVIMPQIKPAMERFEAAKEAYEEALADAQAAGAADSSLPAYVQALKDAIDDDYLEGEKEINFQDVEFYEYFNYNDVKVEGEKLYRTYLAPEVMDTYYILGSGIREAELNDVIAAESNPFIAAGITASRLENDAQAIADSITAKNDWKMPVNTKLSVEDLTSRINYYEQFVKLDANREGNEHLYFLQQEIAHIDAQQLNAEEYEAVTWGRFAAAYEKAVAVANGTDEYAEFNSTIYSAKYELMVKYKELMKKSDSLIDAGGTADLITNIDTANAIFASLEAGDGAWVLKEGVDADKAYAALISALGYYYVGEDGVTYNLYADSALEYRDNDRPNRSGNQAKVNTANAALVTAIENFEEVVTVVEYTVTYTDGADGEVFADETYTVEEGTATPAFQGSTDREGFEFLGWTPQIADTVTGNVTYTAMWEEIIPEMDPSTLMVEEGFEYADYVVIDTANNNYGEYTGIVYGIDTLDQNEMMEILGTLDDALTTNNGDDYLVIEANENGGVESTGATITVVDENGDVLETYVFVYFGDVDGDAMISANDALIAEYYEVTYEGVSTYAEYVATDIDCDGMTSANDALIMEYYEVTYEGVDYQYNLGQMAMCNTYEWIF